ncbi:PHP domain-containing protein [Allocoleopsis franciscana]|uniref:Putative metal-dependent phosphoesterase, PHP family n=1 Tax=Allocoleopsis franciscana PCC 7113 TaxID=1173027 RepID=K9WGG8_9CYAN|nr:PHP domain-containing protein [Allocoleopsis franciscana]AFZ18911.1 putative metal-dependent phosphoesterase, PHP family [Allocoleopsis franciscana PCC 7113]
MIELHCHTTCSDGTLTPTQLVQAAVQAGVFALAITDHDTLSGWNEALAAAKPYNLEIVPGVELSTVHRDRSLHILGFYPNADQLKAPLAERIEGRKRRAHEMVAKLAELGYPISLPQLGEGVAPSRPHLAKALVEAGYFPSMEKAFDRLLGDNQPAYVQYEKFSISEGIALLRDCGAVPVWAHPYLFRGGAVEDVLKELVEVGLMGIEVYHPSHTSKQTKNLEALCVEYGLLMTGGSDYHGPSPDGKAQSISLNMMQLPLGLLDPIKHAAHRLK